jgi:hypothetical protein
MKYIESLTFFDASFGSNLILFEVLVRDNPNKQVPGAALKAAACITVASQSQHEVGNAMLPESDTTFLDDKVVAAENPLFCS